MLIPLPDDRIDIAGASWFEPDEHGLLPHRLPAWTRAQYPDPLYALNVTQGSGVRVRFATAGRRISLHVAVSRGRYVPIPPQVEGPLPEPALFDWVVDGEHVASARPAEAGVLTLDALSATYTDEPGTPSCVTLDLPPADGRVRQVEAWLPYRERVRLIAVESDHDVVAPAPRESVRWVHHGSSISHGAEAASPLGTWPAVAARAAGADLMNLGFSGAAVLDPFVARTMRDERADLLSVKIGINVLNGDSYRERMFGPLLHGFLDTIRDGHPDTPLLVVSPLFCPIAENVPGPTWVDPDMLPTVLFTSRGRREEVAEGKLTLVRMRQIVAEVVRARRAAGDAALHHLDGLDLYGPGDWKQYPMADLLHPDPPAQRLVGERFAPVLRDLLPTPS